MKLTIVLGMPHKALSPNARVHWAAKARQVKHARLEAKLSAISEMNKVGREHFPLSIATVQATFYFKTNRRRDLDNLQASLKSAMDGLADAGIVANDAQFIPLPCKTNWQPGRTTEFVAIDIEGEPAKGKAA